MEVIEEWALLGSLVCCSESWGSVHLSSLNYQRCFSCHFDIILLLQAAPSLPDFFPLQIALGGQVPAPCLVFFSARPRDEICGESSPCDVVLLWSTTFNFSPDPSLPFSNNKILSSSPLSVFDLLTSAREKRGEKAICYTRPGFEKKHTHRIWDLFK